ncbi:MAG: hypothetical protein HRT87_00720 [Legionellales bacterium]|nr:hypothetical protein [Legionellales bacterium]
MKVNVDNCQKDLEEKGYVIINDFLPKEMAQELNKLYLAENEKNWEFLDQTREGYYSHVFKTENPLCPRENEEYKAKFWRSKDLESNQNFTEIFNNNFKNKIREMSGVNLQNFDKRCYRLKQGDYYRLHIDDYAGDIGSIYYVNEDWRWDWGGILHVCDHVDQEYILPIFPLFNRLVLVNHKKFRVPHFISQVSEFALNPRFTIIGFNS